MNHTFAKSAFQGEQKNKLIKKQIINHFFNVFGKSAFGSPRPQQLPPVLLYLPTGAITPWSSNNHDAYNKLTEECLPGKAKVADIEGYLVLKHFFKMDVRLTASQMEGVTKSWEQL